MTKAEARTAYVAYQAIGAAEWALENASRFDASFRPARHAVRVAREAVAKVTAEAVRTELEGMLAPLGESLRRIRETRHRRHAGALV